MSLHGAEHICLEMLVQVDWKAEMRIYSCIKFPRSPCACLSTLAWKEWCLSISPKVGKSLTFREAVKLHLGELQSKLVVEYGSSVQVEGRIAKTSLLLELLLLLLLWWWWRRRRWWQVAAVCARLGFNLYNTQCRHDSAGAVYLYIYANAVAPKATPYWMPVRKP